MADDQVKYSDLIAQDVQPGLTMLAEALKAVAEQIASLKTEATALKGAMSAAGTATREQQQATAQQAASVEGLSKKVKQLTEEERRLEEVRKRYKKLTDEQIERVNAFQQALRGSTQQQMAAVNAIDVETKSYNELNAMYNALKDSLNAMTVAERQNTEAGKAMTMQSAKIYDTMNELQKATGKYTLQVGKYRAAFDGLDYSFQQILREAPSALNLNQFFLAISNNIPMFLDQLKSFQNEQKEIKANLAQMTEGTKEYSEQLGKVMTVGQKLGKTLLSWQTLVLVGLLIIRNWEKIVNLFQKLFNKVEDNLASLRKMRQVVNEIDASVESSISKMVVELGELVNRLDSVTQGSVEWKNITERINEIMGDNYDLTGKMPGQIKQITAAYIAQAEQLAKNQFVVQKISENADKAFKRQRAIETILQGGDVKSAAKIFGYEEGSDEYKALERAANTSMPLPSQTDANEKIWEVVDGKPRRVGYDKWMTDQLNRTFDELDGELFTSQDLQKLWDKYYKAMPEGKGDDGKEPKDQVADLLTLTRQLEDQIIANIENEYKRLDEEETKRHERFIEDRQAELKLLPANDPRRAVINQQIEEEERTHERNMEAIDQKRYDELAKLTQKRLEDEKKAEEAARKAAEEAFKQEEKEFKQRQEIDKRLFQLTKHTATEEKKFVMQQQMEFLQWRIDHAAALGISPEMLEVMKKEYAQMMEMFNKGIYSTGKKNTYSSGMEVIADVLGFDIDQNQISALNSVFDQAKEALNSWMDARKAAADQAKELADDEVSAAENALNREIELRNQGYANDVALREKELADAKAAQKKAAEEQKKVAQEQVLLDAALQTSSMITASANIIKQFPNPLAWAPMLALMWGTFAYAKTKAYQASTKSIKFKEGGVMLLEGGSHESGHDVNLGIGPDGSNLRAEGGEYFAVINKRSSRKYGSQIPAVVNALNSGMFEDRYIKTSDAVGLLPQVIRADNGTAVDLSSLEGGVDALVKQGEQNWTVEGGYRVLRYKNLTRRVKIG